MNAPDLDQIVRNLTTLPTRRAFIRAALGVAVMFGLTQHPSGTDAGKRRRKRRKNKKKKVTLNAFGCVDVGKFCKSDDQCCSGICEGKKDKKRCQAHDQSTCLPGQDACLGDEVACTVTDGEAGVCLTTTGQAGYCSNLVACFPCTKDSDCVPFCGVGAACVACAGCDESGGTACAGLEVCTIPI